MRIREYQLEAKVSALYKDRILYPALGLAGEVGEVAELIKKWLRDEDTIVMSDERRAKLHDEIGDVLWYVAALCSDLGFDMGEVAEANITKLRGRMERDVIHGDGDNR